MPHFYALALLFSLLLNTAAAAEPPSPWQQAAALPDFGAIAHAAPPALLGQALVGRWHGTLRYRDYRSDQAVTLPTSLGIDGASDALQLAFRYDDGPGKTVHSSEQWSLAGDKLTMGKTGAPLAVSVYRGNEKGDMVLIAHGSGIENGAAVEVRSVVLRRGDALSISRSSRLPQQDWLLRHVLQLTPSR